MAIIRSLLLLLLVIIVVQATLERHTPKHYKTKRQGCSRKPLDGVIPQRVIHKEPWKYTVELPAQFDWRYHNHKVLVTPIQNQFMPKFCGTY
jgi:hypothetical protein